MLILNARKIVAKIHNEFDFAASNLLETSTTVLKSKAKRLRDLGFVRAKSAKDLPINELAVYYQMKYPLLKFIDEGSLTRICKKYGLVYQPVENFIGDVPLKNICEIESAKKI